MAFGIAATVTEAAGLPASVLLVGCGNMGHALLDGWRDHLDVAVLDPHASLPPGIDRLTGSSDLVDVPAPRIVVLAVKPALVADVLAGFRPFADRDTMFLSVAAGIPLETLRQAIGPSGSVARAMPNIAVARRAGATAMCFEPTISDAQRSMCVSLFALVGEVALLSSEPLIDVATALAGSGPAFFFRFGEALAAAAERCGIPPEQSRRLARATLRGAGAMCDGSQTLDALRLAVTSPGGTTAAGLGRLDENERIDALARDAVRAATDRARELRA